MQFQPPATRWCHLTWSTAGRHEFFNIAALARFCERELVKACVRLGWRCEAAMLPNRVHVLLQVPAGFPRDRLVREVRTAAATALRQAGRGPAGQRLWEDRCWCSILPAGTAVEAVRKKIQAIHSLPSAPTARNDGSAVR